MSTNPFEKFDYQVECDDFLLYELGRLIDEDRASLDDDEFRRVIESGIHEHLERRLDTRARLAMALRTSGRLNDRTLRAIEDIEASVGDIPQIIHSYAAYLFERLEHCSASDPDERITAAADRLLEAPEDRAQAGAAIDLLGSIPSAVSARILAYVISEPMLEEDLEMKAYQCVRTMWPLPRHFILYSLKPHTHEDIPFRWFQLLIDCDEPSAVDRILEEVIVHGGNPDYREDLLALVQLLHQAGDPETEDKIVHLLNTEQTPKAAAGFLEGFLKSTKAPGHKHTKKVSPWDELERAYAANRRYLAAAQLFDKGKKAEAAQAVEELLQEAPRYPFALMLKQLL